MINLSSLSSLDIFLIWLSLISISLFTYSLFSLKKAKKDSKRILTQEEKRWHELEDKAQKDYQEILGTANSKAKEIISQATEINNQTANNFDESFNLILENQKKALESSSNSLSEKHLEEIDQLNKQSILILTNVYKDIENSAKADLAQYKEMVNKQTFEAERIAQDRIKEEYIKLENEMKLMREKRMQELDENIYKILSMISKEVIGKALNFNDHEELVIKTLDEAKKEGVI